MMGDKINNQKKNNFTLWHIKQSIKEFLGKSTNVYFISGMCYNCSVFDNIKLPKGYKKRYIEWEVPKSDESLRNYAKRMASSIDTKHKFILVGYSLGGILVQEIATFKKPEKVVIISSMKDEKETPHIFEIARKVNFADNIPLRVYQSSNFIINLFNRYIYNLPTKALTEYMTMTDPEYIRWSLRLITHWIPKKKINNLYHIHGTKDQVFPYEQTIDAIAVKGGDHLMIVKRPDEISSILEAIFRKEDQRKR